MYVDTVQFGTLAGGARFYKTEPNGITMSEYRKLANYGQSDARVDGIKQADAMRLDTGELVAVNAYDRVVVPKEVTAEVIKPGECDTKIGNVTIMHRSKPLPSTVVFVDGKEIKNLVGLHLKCTIQEPFTVTLETSALVTEEGQNNA